MSINEENKGEKEAEAEHFKEKLREKLRIIFDHGRADDMFSDQTGDKMAKLYKTRNYPMYLKYKVRIKTINSIH